MAITNWETLSVSVSETYCAGIFGKGAESFQETTKLLE